MKTTVKNGQQALAQMLSLTNKGPTYFVTLDILEPGDGVIETPLWPKEALEYYTAWNLGKEVDPKSPLRKESRGGDQGDYRVAINDKIENVVDCLTKFPYSKRAFITIPNFGNLKHDQTSGMKCMREIQFIRTPGDPNLHCAVHMRAQAVSIFPKNYHFLVSLFKEVCDRLEVGMGFVHYHANIVVGERED